MSGETGLKSVSKPTCPGEFSDGHLQLKIAPIQGHGGRETGLQIGGS